MLRHRARWYPLLVMFLALALASPGSAWAKKKGKKRKKNADVELIGVKSMDKVFRQVRKLDGRVTSAEKGRRKGKSNVNNAMGLSPKTSLSQAMKNLKRTGGKHIDVVKKGKAPQLKAAPDAPQEVKKGIDAVNTALDNYTTAITDLTSLPSEATKLIDQCKAFPSTLKSEIGANPIKAITMIKTLKATKNNISIASALPKRSTRVTKNLTKDVNVIVTTFGGAALGIL